MARSKISFTTCNLFNLNEPGLKLYDQPGWTQQQYDAKVAWLGAAMKIMKADIFGFQELWHEASLKACIEAAGLADDYVALVPAGHTGQGIVCGAAVRKDLLVGEPEWIEDFPPNFVVQSQGDDPQTPEIELHLKKFSRPVLHVEIKPEGNGAPNIHVYVCHLKSKLPTQISREDWYDAAKHKPHQEALGAALATIRRTAEAAALRMILVNRMRGTDEAVAVLGDINDGLLSNTANILTGQPNYLVGLSSGGSDSDVYTAQTLQQYRSTRDVYYTHIHQNERESLDHILVSQEFYDNSRKRIWAFAGLEILNDHLNRDDHKQVGSTDHGLVRATFELHPAKAEADAIS